MYCTDCGKENLATSKFCYACGHELIAVSPLGQALSRGPQATPVVVAGPIPESTATKRPSSGHDFVGHDRPPVNKLMIADVGAASTESGPRGVGGWLMFFALSIMLLAPLLAIGSDVSGWNDIKKAIALYPSFASPTYLLIGYDVLISLYGIIVGWAILAGSASGGRFAREYLWIRLALGVGTLIIAGGLYSEISPNVMGAVMPEIGRAGGQIVLSSIIWISYFARSKRVRNTYG